MSPSTAKPPFYKYLPSLAVLAFVAAAATQGYKQIAQGKSILKEAQRTGRYLFTSISEPKRGAIFSSDGEVLAQNQDAATIGIRFDRVPNSTGFFMAVAEATGISASELEQFADDPKIKSREWRRELSSDQVRRLEAAKSEWRADGLSIHRNGVREYPLGASLSSLLGMVEESNGSFGVEKTLNQSLRGTAGKTVGIVDRDGAFLPMRLDNETVKRVDGRDLVLTIDSKLQQEATRAVRKAVEEFKAESGSAIVIDPATGDILAMSNWPSFDPDDPAEGANDGVVSVGLNPSYMSIWEPGSTFKTLTLALALDEGVIPSGYKIHCTGGLNVWKGIDIHCDAKRGVIGHGSIDPVLAIAKSCNVSAAIWAKKVGYARFVKFIDEVGLTEPTGIPVTGEVRGGYKRDEYAKGLQLATFGFGQSLTVTPLGMIDAFSLLANKGIRMKPRLVKSIGGIEQPVKAYPQVIKAETCDEVLRCMKAVVESDAGTGRKLRIPGYEMGGKTGTAEKIGQSSKERKGYVSNFVGFVPALEPRAVILVMIDDPKTAHYGAEVAGPVFLEIAKKAIDRLRISPTSKRVAVDGANRSKANPSNTRESGMRPEESDKSPLRPSPNSKGPNVDVDSKKLNRRPRIEVQVAPKVNGGA